VAVDPSPENPAEPSVISVRRISSEEFAAMRDEWNELLSRCAGSSPMLTWEWAFSWWEAYRDSKTSRELRVLTARREDGRLLGIAPLVLRPWREFAIPMRRLEFIGTGEAEEDETCSEFLDIVADREASAEVVRAFLKSLIEDDTWDEMVCRDVRKDVPSAVWQLRDLASDGAWRLRVREFGAARCPFVRLPSSWEDYLSTLSRNSRKTVRHKRRQIEAGGEVRFAVAETPEALERAFSAFLTLHQERWKSADREGCFASPVFADFMRRLTPRLARRGGVRIATLETNGEAAAAYYLLCDDRAWHYYNSGMALERFGGLSPGGVCQGYIIEEAIRRGLAEYHFLKGGAGSYKYHWTDQAVPVASLHVARRGWKEAAGRAAGWARAVKRALWKGAAGSRRAERRETDGEK
jgi:CelD/BcsL family acetyltransferase involved in cellulose biosynthesis